LLTNSERYRSATAGYLGEELEMTFMWSGGAGNPINTTQEPGHQLGFFALNGSGEFVYESKENGNSSTSQLFLQYGSFVTELNIDPGDQHNDTYPHWFVPE
jgi:hypothetical protein